MSMRKGLLDMNDTHDVSLDLTDSHRFTGGSALKVAFYQDEDDVVRETEGFADGESQDLKQSINSGSLVIHLFL